MKKRNIFADWGNRAVAKISFTRILRGASDLVEKFSDFLKERADAKERLIMRQRETAPGQKEISVAQEVSHPVTRDAESLGVSRATAQTIAAHHKIYKAEFMGDFMAKNDIDFDFGKKGKKRADELLEEAGEFLSRSRQGQMLREKMDEGYEKSLAKGEDGLKVEKAIDVVRKDDGEAVVHESEAVISPRLPREAPEILKDVKPSGLSEKQQEQLILMDEDKFRNGRMKDLESEPVRVEPWRGAKRFAARGELKLSEHIYEFMSGKTSTADAYYHEWKSGDAARLKAENPYEFEREKKIQELKSRFSWAAQDCLSNLGMTLDDQPKCGSRVRSYDGTSHYYDQATDTYQSMDLRMVQADIPLSNLMSATSEQREGKPHNFFNAVERMFYEYNGALLEKSDPGYRFNPETLECTYNGVPMEKKDGAYEYPADREDSTPFDFDVITNTRRMSQCAATLGVDAYCNNDYTSPQSFATAMRVSFPVPDEFRGTQSYRNIEKIVERGGDRIKIENGCLILRRVDNISADFPDPDKLRKQIAAQLESVFHHTAFAEGVKAKNNETRKERQEEIARIKAEKAKQSGPKM